MWVPRCQHVRQALDSRDQYRGRGVTSTSSENTPSPRPWPTQQEWEQATAGSRRRAVPVDSARSRASSARSTSSRELSLLTRPQCLASSCGGPKLG